MQTNQNAPAQEVDPLAIPGDQVKIEFPLIRADVVDNFILSKMELKTHDGGGRSLQMEVRTTKDYVALKGEQLNAGHIIRQSIYCTPTGGLTADKIAASIKRLTAACGKPQLSALDVINNPGQFNDVVFTGKTRIVVDKRGEFPDKNEVSFVPPKKA